MKAPAKTVALARAEAKVEDIEKPLSLSGGPDRRVRAHINAGAVPIGKTVHFQCAPLTIGEIC
jgi:hypothetical protein